MKGLIQMLEMEYIKRLKYFIHCAYVAYRNSEAIPEDVFDGLMSCGISPDDIYDMFDSGLTPKEMVFLQWEFGRD